MGVSVRASLALDSVVLAIFAGMALIATGFSDLARIFPLTVALAGVALALARLASESWKLRRSAPAEEGNDADPSPEDSLGRVAYLFGWLIGYMLIIWVAGFLIATAAFLGGYLWIEGKVRWFHTLLVVAIAIAVLYVLASQLGIVWPSGLVQL